MKKNILKKEQEKNDQFIKRNYHQRRENKSEEVRKK